jgi:hypothetical protein
LRDTIGKLPEKEQTNALAGALENIPPKQLQEVFNRVLPPPGGPTRDKLWMLVVCSFCIVFVGSFGALVVCVFTELPKDNRASPEILLATFTTVVGFLAGLFVPAPTSGSRGG